MKQAARAREEDQIRAISELTTVRRGFERRNRFRFLSHTNTNTHMQKVKLYDDARNLSTRDGLICALDEK